MRRLLLLVLIFYSVCASAVDIGAHFDLQANGFYRKLSQQGFSDATSVTDGTVFAGTQILVSESSFEFEARHELRTLFGDSPRYSEGDIARLSIRSPHRFLRLGGTLAENRNLEMISDFERMRASYLWSSGEAWVGRRPISLGTLSFFRVWNKFTRPISGLFGPTIVFGSDGGGASFQSGSFSVRGFSLLGATHEDDANLAEATWYGDFAELRLLGGSWWRNTAAGFAFSRIVFDWMLRGELLYLTGSGDHAYSDSETQLGMGLDGAINSDFSLLLEGYYQSIGTMDTSTYSVSDPSRFTYLRARYYAFGMLNWQAGTLWKFGIGDLVNVVDGGQITVLKATHSLSNAVEAVGEANLPIAGDGAEFSKRSFLFKDGNYLGTGKQFTLGVKAAF